MRTPLHAGLAATYLALAIAATAGSAASDDPRWFLPLFLWLISVLAAIRAALSLRSQVVQIPAYDHSTLIMSVAFLCLAMQLVIRLFSVGHFGG